MGGHRASENRKARLKRWLKNEKGRERAALARAAGTEAPKAAKPKAAKKAD